MLCAEFSVPEGYLDSATYGLPPRSALVALAEVTAAWAEGSYEPVSCDAAVARARAAFARLHGVQTGEVAIGHQVSPFVGVVASALPRGARVLAPEGEFTSLLFPFLAVGCQVRTVALEELAGAVYSGTDAVVVSAVQSADGRVADVASIAEAARSHRALSVLDATQACGWLPLDGKRFDVTIAGGYKWLCHPRGTAFMIVGEEVGERLSATGAGWYGADRPWESCYGTPLRQAPDARRFDISPAWFSWHAAAAALDVFESVGVDRIYEHNLRLANRLRTGLDLAPGDSAIVSLPAGESAARELTRAGVRASVRAGRARISCHLYNTEADIDRALEALSGQSVRMAG